MLAPDGRCQQFSLAIGRFALPRGSACALVPVETCAVAAAFVGSLYEAMPALSYGPDGRLATRSACTSVRWEQSCRPALAAECATDVTVTPWRWRSSRAQQVRADNRRLVQEAAALHSRAREARERCRGLAGRAVFNVTHARDLCRQVCDAGRTAP